MKHKIISLFLAAAMMVTSLAVFPADSTKAAEQTPEFDCICRAATKETEPNYVNYGASAVRSMTAQEAQMAGVPEGYEGQVISVEDSRYIRGVLLDFSEKKIPTSIVKSMTFRFYVSDNGTSSGYPQMRIPKPGKVGTDWVMMQDINARLNQWTEITLGVAEKTFVANTDFTYLSADGYLDKFELALRGRAESTEVKYYIDSVRVNLKDNDGVGPVIDCGTSDTVTVYTNGTLTATAYDATEQRNVDVVYVWPEGTTLSENGLPSPGIYALILKASDYYGNTTTKDLTVIVKEPDTQAPVIAMNVTEIHAKTGTIPVLSATATDNSEMKPQIAYTWSEGALDIGGRLTKGEHTWTVTATDDANNVTTKSVKVHVTDEGHTNGYVVDEEELSKPVDPCIDGHTLKAVKAVSATYEKAGKKAHYKCSVCGKLYSDAKGTKAVTQESLTVKKKTVPATALSKVTAKKKALAVKWKKKSDVTGYQIQVSTKKNFKSSVKTVKVSGAKKTSVTVKKLKAKKTYYVRIRSYKKVGKKTYYSAWSSKIQKKKTK